jgi:hypothetical protein
MTPAPTAGCRPVPAAPPAGGIDALHLPLPDHHLLPCATAPGQAGCDQPTDSDLALLRNPADATALVPLQPPAEEDARARYRWFIGHHLSFCVWRLLAETLSRLAGHARPPAGIVSAAARMYDVYSVLLLYSGSCSTDVYNGVIRPEMMGADPAFSGRWSRDYEQIPDLARAARAAHPQTLVSGLLQAARTNQLVHIAVARRLVPGGMSLLRAAGRNPGSPATDGDRDTFDALFLVQRAPVCRRTFTAQLLRRLTQVLCDLDRYPLPVEAAHRSGPLAADAGAVLGLAQASVTVLRGFAESLLPHRHPDD